jgi:hypothetical protein
VLDYLPFDRVLEAEVELLQGLAGRKAGLAALYGQRWQRLAQEDELGPHRRYRIPPKGFP